MAEEKSYRFRIWVQILAVGGLIYSTLFLFLAIAILFIDLVYESETAVRIFGSIPSPLLPDVLLLPEQPDFKNEAVGKLLDGIALIIAILNVAVAVSLVRGSSASSVVDPTRAFALLRIWRNWTLLFSAIVVLDYVRTAELLGFDLLVSAIQLVPVLLFAAELKKRIRRGSEQSPSQRQLAEECCKLQEEDSV